MGIEDVDNPSWRTNDDFQRSYTHNRPRPSQAAPTARPEQAPANSQNQGGQNNQTNPQNARRD